MTRQLHIVEFPSLFTQDGRTCIFWAVNNGNTAVCKLLLDARADPTLLNNVLPSYFRLLRKNTERVKFGARGSVCGENGDIVDGS